MRIFYPHIDCAITGRLCHPSSAEDIEPIPANVHYKVVETPAKDNTKINRRIGEAAKPYRNLSTLQKESVSFVHPV